MMKSIAGMVCALVLSAGVAGAQVPQPDPKLVPIGRKLFAEKMCTTCHMAEGTGNKTVPVPLDALTPKMKPADIRRWITDPAAMTAKLATKPLLPMPKLPLTDPEVDALVAYLAALAPPKP